MAILEVDGVVKRFGGLLALNKVSLAVESGEVFGLIGPNGAGKTTLLNVIAGAQRPDAGSVRLNGVSITGMRPEHVCRRGIARTFQICRPFSKMSALENVLVAAAFGHAGRVHDPLARAEAALDFVEFPLPKETPASALNTGQLRRLDVARALASDPQVLLLDEAAAGLTPGELVALQDLILRIRERGVTILIVEHLMRLITRCCDRIAVLHYGQKIAEGTPAAVMADEQVTTAYLGTAGTGSKEVKGVASCSK